MSEEKPSAGKIINSWKKNNFVSKVSDRGTPFLILPNSCRMEVLAILAKTLHDNGYSYDDMNNFRISTLIADACWRDDKIVKMSGPQIVKAKLSVTRDWQETIDGMYGDVVISKLEEHEKPVFKPEEKPEVKYEQHKPANTPLEIEPSDRIKMDTSDLLECPIDEEIAAEFAEIGIILKDDE